MNVLIVKFTHTHGSDQLDDLAMCVCFAMVFSAFF